MLLADAAPLDAGAILGTVSVLLVGLLAFLGRNVLGDIKIHDAKLAQHETKHAIADDRHGTLLQDVRDLKADMRVVRSWVDSQSDPSQPRRRGDTKE